MSFKKKFNFMSLFFILNYFYSCGSSNSDTASKPIEGYQIYSDLIDFGDKKIPLYYRNHLSLENVTKALAHKKFKDWKTNITSNFASNNKYTMNKLHFDHISMFGPNVGFIYAQLDTSFKNKNGEIKTVPGIAFIRGGAVGVLVVLNIKDSTSPDEKYTILTVQPRIPAGYSQFPEIPAGMIDADSNFAGVAAKEIKEETSITIEQKDLIDLTKYAYGDNYPGMWPSAGGSDEFLGLFFVEKEITQEELNTLQGKATGVLEEGEDITLKIIKLNDLWKEAPDAKALSALYLYEKYKKEKS